MRSTAMRAGRAIAGALLVIVSYPMVLASGGLWLATQHRGAGRAYTAVTQHLHTDGYALVADDVDALLDRDAPLARFGQTRLRLSASGPGGPLFIGLAPYPAVRRYLAGAPYTRVDRVRPARGPLPGARGGAGPAPRPGPPPRRCPARPPRRGCRSASRSGSPPVPGSPGTAGSRTP
jgi:hypothetical protein